ncbi:MAG: glycosyltransferase family 87 protein, partial [Planctomycetia bacterium]
MKVFGRDWPLPIILVWQAVALFVVAVQGPGFVQKFDYDVRTDGPNDFFQEWASTQNFYLGRPIYTMQTRALEDFTSFRAPTDQVYLLKYNAHPPASVLATLPFAGREPSDAAFRRAFRWWNVASLACLGVAGWLLFRGLRLSIPIALVLPAVALLLLSGPFRQQFNQGQWNAVLLLLLTTAWQSDRTGRPLLAGAALGTAVALKLFPGGVLLYFAARRNWSAAGMAAATAAAVNGAAVVLFGWEAYRDYLTVVLPSLDGFRCSWINYSAFGFWDRLFVGDLNEKVTPLVYAPWAARLGVAATVAAVGWAAWRGAARADGTADRDRAFAAAVVFCLVASPVSWDHGMLLLALPAAVLAKGAAARPWSTAVGLGAVVALNVS